MRVDSLNNLINIYVFNTNYSAVLQNFTPTTAGFVRKNVININSSTIMAQLEYLNTSIIGTDYYLMYIDSNHNYNRTAFYLKHIIITFFKISV